MNSTEIRRDYRPHTLGKPRKCMGIGRAIDLRDLERLAVAYNSWRRYSLNDHSTFCFPSMVGNTHRNDFLASLVRCLESPDFLPSFYDRFVGSSEDVQRKFRATDFQQQYAMLARSLRLIAMASAGDPDGLQELAERAESHSQFRRDIQPELYQLWLRATIETARDFDPEWSDSIEEAWKSILQYAINYMVRRY